MLKEEISKLKKESFGLQEKLANLQNELGAKIKTLEDAKNAAEKDKKQFELEIARLKKDNRTSILMQELEAVRSEIQRISDENEHLSNELANMKRECDKLNNLNQTALEEKKELEDKIAYFRTLVNQLTKDNAGNTF